MHAGSELVLIGPTWCSFDFLDSFLFCEASGEIICFAVGTEDVHHQKWGGLGSSERRCVVQQLRITSLRL